MDLRQETALLPEQCFQLHGSSDPVTALQWSRRAVARHRRQHFGDRGQAARRYPGARLHAHRAGDFVFRRAHQPRLRNRRPISLARPTDRPPPPPLHRPLRRRAWGRVGRASGLSIGGAGNLACSRLSGGFPGHVRVIAPKKRRLKAAQRAPRSQEWLPHKTGRSSSAHRYPGQPPAPRTFSSTSLATAAVFAWIVSVSSTLCAYPPASTIATGIPCVNAVRITRRSRSINPSNVSESPPN